MVGRVDAIVPAGYVIRCQVSGVSFERECWKAPEYEYDDEYE